MESDIAANIMRVKHRIVAAATRAGRDPAAIKLIAVTKTVATERIRLAAEAGLTLFGENYVQEARDKITDLGIVASWHMIGYLQANKVKYAVKMFDYIHSVDRFELAAELARRTRSINRRLKILIEVNVSGEKSKSGIGSLQAKELVRQISALPELDVRGLMTMTPYSDNPENSRLYFQALRHLCNDIDRAGIDNIRMKELSMGMTDDFEVAIEEGATMVRIGRAIFGERR